MASDGDPAQPEAATAPSSRATVLNVDLAWQTTLAVVVSVVVLVALRGAVRTASIAFTVIVVALFLAMALDPLVNAIGRALRLGRGWSTVSVLSGLVVLTGAFVAFAVPQLVSESRSLATQLPATVSSLDDLPLVGDAIRRADLSTRLTDALATLPEKAHDADIGGLLTNVGFGLGEVLLAFFLLAGALFEGPRMIADVRRAVPAARRAAADRLGRTVYQVLAKYFAGSLVIAVANGLWVAVSALVAGVPLSPVLGVWAALTSLIPQLGGLLGFSLVFLVSLTAGVVPTLIMTVSFLAFMLLNNHVLMPTVVGRAVSLSAPVTMLAAIGGFSVGGIIGALFAVPTFGAIKAVAMAMRSDGSTPPALDADPDAPERPHGLLGRVRSRFAHH